MDNRKYIKLYKIYFELCGYFSTEYIKASNIISAYFKFKKYAKERNEHKKIVKIRKVYISRYIYYDNRVNKDISIY